MYTKQDNLEGNMFLITYCYIGFVKQVCLLLLATVRDKTRGNGGVCWAGLKHSTG